MRKEILFEKFESPTFINEEGVMYWENKAGILHRGYYRPAVLDTKFHTAWFIVNGKVIRVENTYSIEEQIREIMEEFDFDNVWNTMNMLHWVWVSSNGVPDINQLKEAANRNLHEAAKHFYNSDEQNEILVGSGGFEATCNNYGMRLRFVLEDWETKVDSDFKRY